MHWTTGSSFVVFFIFFVVFILEKASTFSLPTDVFYAPGTLVISDHMTCSVTDARLQGDHIKKENMDDDEAALPSCKLQNLNFSG